MPSTSHGEVLSAAANKFHEALTLRWREVTCEAIVNAHDRTGGHDFPTVLNAPVDSYVGFQRGQSMWDYRHYLARVHLANGGAMCAYVNWVQGGQGNDLSTVRCDGITGAREGGEEGTDFRTGEAHIVPPHIECGVGSILRQVEDWAWAEHNHVFQSLPLFDHHDLDALETAHDALIRLGALLGLENDGQSAAGLSGAFSTDSADRDIPSRVLEVSTEMNDEDGADREKDLQRDWWTAWTGLKSSRFQTGFFSHVAPTLNNQSGIVGVLANLFAYRAMTIDKARNDGLYWLEWATGSLGRTEVEFIDRTEGWRKVQRIGATTGMATAWIPVAGKIGVAVTLIGWLGEQLDQGTHREDWAQGLGEVVSRLNTKIKDLNAEIAEQEQEYAEAVTTLQATIGGLDSNDLELYDFSGNSADGEQDRGTGFEVNVLTVFRLAAACFDLGERYAELFPVLAETAAGDSHLADKDGIQIAADAGVLEVRDLLDQFLRTSAGRYLIAGDQVVDAAKAYSESEEALSEVFRRTLNDFEREGMGEVDVDFDRDEYAEATDRSTVGS